MAPLELVSGFPYGMDPTAPPLDRTTAQPLEAFETALMPGLLRPPCYVSFSGGRDSSAVLAVATRLARREGLPLPVPVTLSFPGTTRTDERVWQELVIDDLKLDEWVRLELYDELDLVGPLAGGVLRRHGLVWPPNTHFHVPVLEVARGGAMLTGIDGDGLLGAWAWLRVANVLGRRVRPTPRDVARIAKAWSPAVGRRTIERRWPPPDLPWLREAAIAELNRAWRRDRSGEPWRWEARVAWFARRRALRLTIENLGVVAREYDVLAVNPLAEPVFLAALARAGGTTGLGSRSAVMEAVFGDVLPPAVITRASKAVMDEPAWNRHARSFAEDWGGDGVDGGLVDCERLREAWLSESPDARTSSLLQWAWLSQSVRSRPGTAAPGLDAQNKRKP